MKIESREILFVGTAESEHVEMSLKIIWQIQKDNAPVKINKIANTLNIREPSVVQMLKKLRTKPSNLQQR